MKYKPDDFFYLADVMNSEYDKVNANQSNCNVLYKVIATIHSGSLFFLFKSG